MKYLAAYLLLGLAGNSSPSADDITGAFSFLPVYGTSKTDCELGVLESVGVDVDEERIEKLRAYHLEFIRAAVKC